MSNTRSPVRLLGISGSLRSTSSNTAILSTLVSLLSDKADLALCRLDEVPLYNGDLEGVQLPEAVRALKAAIDRCDGLVICSPEYNYGVPGVLKNAIDWASRPAFQSPLRGKPVLIMTASPGTAGGARAHHQIREALSASLARPIARAQVAIGGVQSKIEGGRLVDESTIQFILGAIDDLIAEIRLLAGHR